jgi:glycosyltransferase involved in cell wall biosynthesis
MRVIYYQRKGTERGFSIEKSFEAMRRHLPDGIQWELATAPHDSKGPARTLSNLIAAQGWTGDISHITGDIHYVAAALPGSRTILTIHDCGYRRKLGGVKRWIMELMWYRIPCSRVALVTAVSEFTKSELVRYVGVPAEKVSVVPTCISPLFRRVDRKFNDERPTVLQVGTAENKNLVRVASALAGLPCHLRVIGRLSVAQERALQGTGVSYSTASNLGEDALFDEYVRADVVAFVSTYEGFGMPIIEGNTVGRPVVTSNVASMPEIAGRAAALVDPFDVGSMREGFRRVVRDRAYRDALVEAGSENARRFSASEVALAYSRLYHSVAASDRGGGRAWR